MWEFISGRILRNKIAILVILGAVTLFMGYYARLVEVQYGLPTLLPKDDSTRVAYRVFQERYGKQGSVIVIGIEQNPLNDLTLFQEWYDLGKELRTIEGVDTIISVANVFNLTKNTQLKKFELHPVVTRKPQNQQQLDSIKGVINDLPFYKGILYNDTSNASLMAISLDSKVFNSNNRMMLIEKVMNKVRVFGEEQHIQMHYSGLPFIRTIITEMVKKELKQFIVLAVIVTIVILLLFFRSVRPVAVSMLVVAIGVVWSLGIMGLLDYQVTILTSIIPPLIIVIGIPNCIFLINKYHSEFKHHGNKAKALSRVIQKVGNATFMTNTTTAVGFVTFVFTQSAVLVEFGVLASLSILILFMLSLLLIPITFSFLNPPKERHTKHLDYVWVRSTVNTLSHIVQNHRRAVYLVTVVLIVVAFFGISKIETTGNIVDDLPERHFVVEDLHFFEKHFNGVMPFEVSIDAKKKGYATKLHTLRKMDKLQQVIAEYPEFSKPISIVEGIKFIKQAYYNGSPSRYDLVNNRERVFFKPYVQNATENQTWLKAFVDSSRQHARISVQMEDVGTKHMDVVLQDLRPKIDSIFNPEKYNVDVTGTSVVFLAGTTYLVKNLFTSLFIAVILIALIMAMLFSSFRMILVSIITNLIPLCLTAAMMGYFGITIKPSTILVFSIAFGISVDDTIHFLAKYRQELKLLNWNIGDAVMAALRETGVSMIYTSIILFFGFSVFDSSEFGGTLALGVLVSITLLTAMLSNLVLLPSFLLSMEKSITTKAFKEPFVEIIDEEEDIELDDLTIKKGDDQGEKAENHQPNGEKAKEEDSTVNSK